MPSQNKEHELPQPRGSWFRLSMEDPTPPLDTPKNMVGGLKTRLCEGPKSIELEPLGTGDLQGSGVTLPYCHLRTPHVQVSQNQNRSA